MPAYRMPTLRKNRQQPVLVGFEEPIEPSVASELLESAAESALPPKPKKDCHSADELPDLAGKTVYVVDSHSLIYQVFHAIPEMTGPSGQPVGAVQGFIRDLLDLIDVRKADYLICAFDEGEITFRNAIYDQYKIHRDPMPADLQLQMPVIRRFLDALGILTLSIPGYEADDILATVAKQIDAAGGRCLLVTSDKDCRQLITDRVQLFNIRKNEIFDDVALQATWGIRPDQVVDFQAIVGDTTDNIPGVAGIGPKGAQELLAKYGTLDEVLAHANEVSGAKRKENLLKGKDLALTSRELARLKSDMDIVIDWPAAVPGHFNVAEIADLCRECGFRQLARRIELLTTKLAGVAPRVEVKSPPSETTSVADGDQPPAEKEAATASDLTTAALPEWKANYRTIATSAELSELVAILEQQSRICLDTETTSLHPRRAEIVGYSFAWSPGEACYIPVRAPAGEPQLDPTLVAAALKPIFENAAIEKIGQNLKYDTIVLRCAGIELRGISFDTMVADYLLEPGERSHNMDDMARRHLCYQTITIDQLIGSGKNQKRMDEVPVATITQYAAEDADVPLRLADALAPRLKGSGIYDLFTDLEMPLIDVLVEMEFNGIRVEVGRLRELSGQFNDEIMRLEREIFEIAGREFNIDSRIQLGDLLFKEFKLPVVKRTKTGPSMDAEALEELALLHPLPAKVIEYRHLAKLKSTYVDALPELVLPATGRVHTSFKQDVAATGRLSSQDPNLQNIPIRTEQGRAIRSAFLPGPPGWQLMAADYSQIELRVLAHFSGDATLRQAFAEDRDIHSQVASEVYSVTIEQVTSEMRRTAKAVNFGVIYGQSPFGLAKTLRIDQADAAEFIDRYFNGLPGVDAFLLQTLVQCRRDGYVSTILGRRRPVSGVRDPAMLSDKRQRNLPERIAINTVIQGSAADIIKKAMINVHRRLAREALQAKLLLQIHDELVLEFPPEERERVEALVTEEMISAVALAVPLKVDVHVGPNWAACE
ncbi:MAG TPA: DNA polymerase I [Pirellulaceae bacterium]|jgi:DNA polymerase-1